MTKRFVKNVLKQSFDFMKECCFYEELYDSDEMKAYFNKTIKTQEDFIKNMAETMNLSNSAVTEGIINFLEEYQDTANEIFFNKEII